MKIKLLPAVFCIAAFAHSGFSQNPGGAVDLKFNVAPGSGFSYSIAATMNMDQTIMGNEIKVYTKVTSGYIFNVTGDSAGWKNITSTVSKIAMDLDAMGNKMRISSDDAPTDTSGPMGNAAAVFAAMKGAKFSFTMNEKGEIANVNGMKEMTDKMMAGIGPGGNPMAAQTLAQAFNENSFKQNLQQSFNVYPGKPVKPGDSWTKSMMIKSAGLDMKLDNTYTLDSVVNGLAKVKVASTMVTPEGATIQGMAVSMTGDMSGVDTFDLATGVPVGGNLTMNMDMKLNAQGQEIPLKMKIDMVIEAKKL